MLKIIYRTATAAYDVAGLQAIDIQDEGLVNVDLSEIISGMCSYIKSLYIERVRDLLAACAAIQ